MERFLELESDDTRVEDLAARRTELDAELDAVAKKLTKLRASAASELEKLVSTELHSLAMPEANFMINIEPAERSAHGGDDSNFLLAAHRGAPARPLGQGAAGGERSRGVLAPEGGLATRRRTSQHTTVFAQA